MILRGVYVTNSVAKASLSWTVSVNFYQHGLRIKTKKSQPVGLVVVTRIILQDFVHHIAVCSVALLIVSDRGCLIPTEHEEKILVVTKGFVPHFLCGVSSITMNFLPLHTPLRLIRTSPGKTSQIHVRCDDGHPVSIRFKDLVHPLKHVIGSVAFDVNNDKIKSARGKKLITVGVVSGNCGGMSGAPRIGSPIPLLILVALSPKILLKQCRVSSSIS